MTGFLNMTRRRGIYRMALSVLLIVLCVLQLTHAEAAPVYTTNNRQTIKKEKNLPQGVLMQGIDVSRWQGTINWASVKKAGVKFAMIGMGRVYSASSYLDPQFKRNVKGANKNGIYTGVYLYSMASTVSQAKREAKWVIKQLDGLDISFPVAFDMEDPSIQHLSRKTKTDIALAFLKAIEDAGYYPVMYASENWFLEGIDLKRIEKYDIWLARWSGIPSMKGYGMWQYTCKGYVSGISGDVDLNFCYKDYAQLINPRKHAQSDEAPVIKTGWQKSGSHYVYVIKDGSTLKNTFTTISKNTYYLDENGYRVSGWKTIGGKTYYFNSKGVMQKGWLSLKGKKYYLHKTRGTRAEGWATIGKKKYYFMPGTGEMVKGWKAIDGKTYYFSSKGVMQKGWLTLKGKKYYLDKTTGEKKTGWLGLSGKKYYLETTSGVMVKGWKQIDGKWYYFSKKGIMQKNRKVGKYRLDKNGVCTNR